MFHLHYKQVLTIHTPVQVFYHKQINLRPWAKPVSHTPRTPLSISSQIFPQVEIHLFCRANIETCLHTVLYLSTAVLNNCYKINQIFIALGEFDAIKSSSSLNFLSHSLKKSMSIYYKKITLLVVSDPSLQDLIGNSPYCLSYSSYGVSSENLQWIN